jgi:hypothetical protein
VVVAASGSTVQCASGIQVCAAVLKVHFGQVGVCPQDQETGPFAFLGGGELSELRAEVRGI